jgi:hypothetical protein
VKNKHPPPTNRVCGNSLILSIFQGKTIKSRSSLKIELNKARENCAFYTQDPQSLFIANKRKDSLPPSLGFLSRFIM